MRLARVFQDNMVLQRQIPILIWGSSDEARSVEIKINGEKICDVGIASGDFSFFLPAQEAVEDAVLEIGEIRLSHVDIGEVWVAGGQSNMEFMMQYTENAEAEMASADDMHLRTYVVGQYSFAGEREAGYKAWNPWDRWLAYQPEHAAELPATAVYFAKELRASGVPVGILSCNWGGTSASAWIDKAILQTDEELKTYQDEFDGLVAKLDLERYYKIKKIVRPAMASPESRKMMGFISKNTLRPDKLMAAMTAQNTEAAAENPAKDAGKAGSSEAANALAGIPQEELMAVGPGDANEPGALYENMLKEIIGYTARGVIWYQGETDEKKAEMYAKLFTAMIHCWRNSWREKNPGMERLPFLFVQLAPFGEWMGNNGNRFPLLRSQQELVSKTVEDTYMTSVSDLGNVFDIHPKNKEQAGKRLALLARKYIYGEEVQADAPEAEKLERDRDAVWIFFRHGEGLYYKERSFTAYNGFELAEINEAWHPPVLDGINGLRLLADGKAVERAQCGIEENQLLIRAEEIAGAKTVSVEFAQTPFYQVNLYNGAGIPAKPFRL